MPLCVNNATKEFFLVLAKLACFENIAWKQGVQRILLQLLTVVYREISFVYFLVGWNTSAVSFTPPLPPECRHLLLTPEVTYFNICIDIFM
jgi:hypothetical protein